MEFKIEKKELSALTTLVYRAASNKHTIPVLSGLFIEVSSTNGLVMTATDMEIGIKASTAQVEVIEAGSVLVNAYYFADFIKLLPDTTIIVKINPEKSRLNITYGRSSGYINIYSEHEYPSLPVSKMEDKFSIPQVILKEALRKTHFAAAGTHFRQVFTGVLFDILPQGELRIVASDTHRLALYTYTLPNVNLEPFNFIIPDRTVNELLRLLEDNEILINIAFSDNNVIFYFDDFILLSRLIDGQYPNYENVIPKSFNTLAKLKTNDLLTTLERAKVMPTDSKVKIPYVKFEFNEFEAIVYTYSEAMGEIEEVIENIDIEGEPELKISFNTTYILDIAKIFNSECEEIIINLSGALSPAIIKNPAKDNYIYVLVPLRTIK